MSSLEENNIDAIMDDHILVDDEIELRKSSRCRDRTIKELPNVLKSIFHKPINKNTSKKLKDSIIHENPNIFLVKHFLSDQQISYFDQLCTKEQNNFKQSYTEYKSESVISEERTSRFLQVTKSKDSVVRSIEDKAASLFGMSQVAVEPLQLIKYSRGDKFELHHDSGTMIDLDATEVEIEYPVRYITTLVYLNDLPEGEGETNFPKLNLSIKPEKGSALIFCNILPSGNPDIRLIHEAKPLLSNLKKYAINIWINDTNYQHLALDDRSNPKKKKIKTNEKSDINPIENNETLNVISTQHNNPDPTAFEYANKLLDKYFKKKNPQESEQCDVSDTSSEVSKVIRGIPEEFKELTTYKTRPVAVILPEVYNVETIIAHKGGPISKKSNLKFLVKWEGYDDSNNQWLPYWELRNNPVLFDYAYEKGESFYHLIKPEYLKNLQNKETSETS